MAATTAGSEAAGAASEDIVRPRVLLAVESAVTLVAAVVLYQIHGGSWWLFGALILAPDLFMVGYAAGPRVGAFVYNLAHMYAGPAILATVGIAVEDDLLISIAIVWLAHIAMDRMIGYGLKYATGFKDSHLSRV